MRMQRRTGAQSLGLLSFFQVRHQARRLDRMFEGTAVLGTKAPGRPEVEPVTRSSVTRLEEWVSDTAEP
jgi:hypothetical protein